MDGLNFDFLAKISGAGNSNRSISYLYFDSIDTPGIKYYRLSQVDFNGRKEYFQVESIQVSNYNKQFIHSINSLGEEVDSSYDGIIFDIYSDGSCEKRINRF